MKAEDYLNEKGIYNHPRLGEHDVAELMEEYAKEKLQEVRKGIKAEDRGEPAYKRTSYEMGRSMGILVSEEIVDKTIKEL